MITFVFIKCSNKYRSNLRAKHLEPWTTWLTKMATIQRTPLYHTESLVVQHAHFHIFKLVWVNRISSYEETTKRITLSKSEKLCLWNLVESGSLWHPFKNVIYLRIQESGAIAFSFLPDRENKMNNLAEWFPTHKLTYVLTEFCTRDTYICLESWQFNSRSILWIPARTLDRDVSGTADSNCRENTSAIKKKGNGINYTWDKKHLYLPMQEMNFNHV